MDIGEPVATVLFLKSLFIERSGRPRALNIEQSALALDLYLNEGLSVRTIADELGVSHMCIWRLLKGMRSGRSE